MAAIVLLLFPKGHLGSRKTLSWRKLALGCIGNLKLGFGGFERKRDTDARLSIFDK